MPRNEAEGLGIEGQLPGDYSRLRLDSGARWGYKPLVTYAGNAYWRQTNTSRYVRPLQSRHSLLIWKVFGQRMDGWTNRIGMADAYTSIPTGTFRAPGAELADLAQPRRRHHGAVANAADDERAKRDLYVAVKDQRGSITRVNQAFSVDMDLRQGTLILRLRSGEARSFDCEMPRLRRFSAQDARAVVEGGRNFSGNCSSGSGAVRLPVRANACLRCHLDQAIER